MGNIFPWSPQVLNIGKEPKGRSEALGSQEHVKAACVKTAGL